jgi:hypothetical protein
MLYILEKEIERRKHFWNGNIMNINLLVTHTHGNLTRYEKTQHDKKKL